MTLFGTVIVVLLEFHTITPPVVRNPKPSHLLPGSWILEEKRALDAVPRVGDQIEDARGFPYLVRIVDWGGPRKAVRVVCVPA